MALSECQLKNYIFAFSPKVTIMRWLFLIPIATGLISGYIAQKSDDEMAYLTGAFTIFSLLLSLILAPWQIQLLILLLVSLAVRQFWLKIESDITSEPIPKNRASDRIIVNEEEKITCKYRGATYEHSVSTTEITTENLHSLQQANPPTQKFELKYRGAIVNNQETNTTRSQDN
jgi:membrane protein implicated in regulation of membrane protease activity